ncbi:MAG: hypothetical protein K2Q10_01355 [Rhodospirillales bacterium]|nr:hypothetical protein [Rhodospirillales bacterium]
MFQSDGLTVALPILHAACVMNGILTRLLLVVALVATVLVMPPRQAFAFAHDSAAVHHGQSHDAAMDHGCDHDHAPPAAEHDSLPMGSCHCAWGTCVPAMAALPGHALPVRVVLGNAILTPPRHLIRPLHDDLPPLRPPRG